MDIDTELSDLVNRYNLIRLREVELDSGLRWLGEAGPIYRLGTVAARGLFVAPDGTHWGEVGLVVESRYPNGGTVRDWAWEQFSFGDIPTFEAVLVSLARGRFAALFASLTDIADRLELDPPQRSTDTWARGWGCLPDISDAHDRELLALGMGEIVTGLW